MGPETSTPVTPAAADTTSAPVNPQDANGSVKPVSGTENTDPLAPRQGERTFKVKVGGREEIWSERKVIERAQKSEGAEQAMKRAAQMEQAFNNFVAQAQDPEKLLALLSNPKALQYDEAKQEALLTAMLNSKNPRIVHKAKQWLYENEVEPATLTEEQRKLRELERFKSDREKSDAIKAEQDRIEREKAEAERIWNDYRLKIGSGLKAEGLPENEAIVARVARKAALMRQANQPADIPAAIKMVKEDWRQEFIKLMTGMTEDQILSMYPEEVLKTINKAFLKKLKQTDNELEPSKGDVSSKRKERTVEDSKKNKQFWKELGRGTLKV